MAARSRKVKLTESWKEKIRISMLLNRLQDHAAGKVEMKNSQVKAAEILLRKVTPDLAATQLTGSEGGPMVLEVVRFADKNSSQ